ncbi:benzoylformate decarboxylase [Novosphingobium sp.]|uniref:benzoylformate decarboxylase n=1 Tax=Novosphingobium sp. TaxID=1874826 RepID=UPI0025ED192A|nr:benzoylformate decarboxylase [Novosphingobium sp.]
MSEVTVREATIALLDSLGMTTIFGNPGSTELPMFRNFPSHFRYVLGLQESVVLGMADGYAQSRRNAALVNLHSAAGVGHALGNLFTAYKNQTPLVVTAGQQARSILPFEPFLYADRPTEFPRPYVKWAVEPARAQDVPAAIARAYHIAMTPPSGPTFVSIPIDDWDQMCTTPALARVAARSCGDAHALAEVATRLARAKRPVLVVGAQIALDDAWEAVIALAERHNAAVWAAPMNARVSFPENHPLFQGFLDAFRDRIVAALDDADLVLVLGGPAFTYHAEGFGPHVPNGAALYLLTNDPGMASWLPQGMAVVTDLRAGISALLDGPAPAPRALPPARNAVQLSRADKLTDGWLMARIAALRPAGSVIVEEAASSRGVMHDHLPITERDGFYTCASGGLGHGLPAAIGVALGRPGERIIAILGDGAAMYAIQGLWSAVKLDLPITFLIVNNSRYEALHAFGRHFALESLVGTDLAGLDFEGLAKAQGMPASKVDSGDELDAALTAAFNSKGPCLLEVPVL